MGKYVCKFEKMRTDLKDIIQNSEQLNILLNSSILENLTANSGWESATREIFDTEMEKKAKKLINDFLEIKRYNKHLEDSLQKIEDAENRLSHGFKL